MIDMFRIDAFIRFYMNQYEFMKICAMYDNQSEMLRLKIEDKERYNFYMGEIPTSFESTSSCIEKINHEIIKFLARRSNAAQKEQGV